MWNTRAQLRTLICGTFTCTGEGGEEKEHRVLRTRYFLSPKATTEALRGEIDYPNLWKYSPPLWSELFIVYSGRITASEALVHLKHAYLLKGNQSHGFLLPWNYRIYAGENQAEFCSFSHLWLQSLNHTWFTPHISHGTANIPPHLKYEEKRRNSDGLKI